MVRNIHRKSNKNTKVLGGAIGIGLAVLLSVLLSALLANLVISGSLQEQNASIAIFLIRTLSVLVGGFVAATISEGKTLPIIGIVGLGYLAILIAFGIIFYDGFFKGFLGGLLSAFVGCALACAIKLKPIKNKRHKIKIPK